jgi:hypothetical protein
MHGMYWVLALTARRSSDQQCPETLCRPHDVWNRVTSCFPLEAVRRQDGSLRGFAFMEKDSNPNTRRGAGDNSVAGIGRLHALTGPIPSNEI